LNFSGHSYFLRKLILVSEFCPCVNEFGLLDNISPHDLSKKMQKVTKYVIFRTKWGYFGLAGTEYALCRTCLPRPSPEKLKSHLLKTLLLPHRASLVRHSFGEGRSIEFDKAFFRPIQEQIATYFEGVCVNFGPDIPVMLDGFSDFQRAVLTECREVRFGQAITYGELAKRSGRPAAARAVGNALAKNPLPLIIPCHRVICSNGSLGGFSGLGGLSLKRKLLAHEQNPLSATVLLHHPPAEAVCQAESKEENYREAWDT
jgi:methylated-DNA-[protein]-cysteine S-methyltransferase